MLRNSSYQFICAAAIYCLFAAFIMTYIGSYAVNWPRVDDFLSVQWYDQMVNQKMIGLSYLWQVRDEGHPLASQALITIALYAIAGIDFRVLIQLNTLIVLGSSMTLSLLLLRQLGASLSTYLASFVLLLAFFQPIQMSHFLWGFELGWFLINLLLVVNAVLIESSLNYKLAAVFTLCVIGAFSSAHGTVLWAAVAFHLFLRDARRYTYFILILVTAFGLNVFHVLSITPKEVTHLAISNVYGLPAYCVQLWGTVFWSRDHSHLFWTGIITLGLTALTLFHASTTYKANKIQRVAIVLIGASLTFIVQFAIGRSQYGVNWALSEFHMASLMIPLLAGLVISSVDWFASSVGRPVITRLAVLAPCFYVAASFLYSVAPAIRFAKEFQMKNEAARHFACRENAPAYVVNGLNLAIQHKDLYLETIPLLKGNCKAQDSWRTRRLLTYPRYFTLLAQQRPQVQNALEALWEVYIVNFDLSHAFPPTDPSQGENLLTWAIGNARTGSQYAPEMLKSHEQTYLSLARP